MTLDFLLACSWEQQNLADRHMAEHTLTRMLNGGIYDQLGGGFHRYSVDAVWLVPHFEKMLYDNAQLMRTCLHAWQLTGHSDYLRVINETFEWLRREMTHPSGGFFSAQDADSEGEEGKFFVWSLEAIEETLSEEEARVVTTVFGVTENGNFEGHNILHRPMAPEEACRRLRMQPRKMQSVLDQAMQTLFDVREQRIHPDTDDKILCEWNGLMIHTLAECGSVLGNPDMLQAARSAADFVWNHMRSPDGTLLRTWKDGTAHLRGYLEDHAAYGACAAGPVRGGREHGVADTRPVRSRRRCSRSSRTRMIPEDFSRRATATRPWSCVARTSRTTPSPAATAWRAELLIRLAWVTDEPRYRASAQRVFQLAGSLLSGYPTAAGRMLAALQTWQATPQEIIITGNPADPVKSDLARQARRMYHPNRIVVEVEPDHGSDLLLLAGKSMPDGQPAAWICQNRTCQAPVHTVQELLASL